MTPQADEFLPTRRSLLSRLKDWDDQVTWSARSLGSFSSLYDVSFGNGTFVAAAADGTILTSTTGTS